MSSCASYRGHISTTGLLLKEQNGAALDAEPTVVQYHTLPSIHISEAYDTTRAFNHFSHAKLTIRSFLCASTSRMSSSASVHHCTTSIRERYGIPAVSIAGLISPQSAHIFTASSHPLIGYPYNAITASWLLRHDLFSRRRVGRICDLYAFPPHRMSSIIPWADLAKDIILMWVFMHEEFFLHVDRLPSENNTCFAQNARRPPSRPDFFRSCRSRLSGLTHYRAENGESEVPTEERWKPLPC